LGERLLCKQEVIGSIPFTSTTDSAKRWRWCVAVAAAVTGKARHESERAKIDGAARCLILQHAAIVTGFARPWRRFVLTALARRSWKIQVCWRLRPSAVFFDRVKRV
jgi:hypothetical protein